MTKKTIKLKSIGEPPKTPLLEPARRVPHRVEAIEQDWVDMNGWLESYRGYHTGELIALMLYNMKAMDETKAPKPTEQDWVDMNKYLEVCRETHSGWGIAKMLHYMKSIDEIHAPKPTEQDWKDMNEQFVDEGHVRWNPERRVWDDDGCDIASRIAKLLHHMKSLDETQAPKPTERDWKDMNTHLEAYRRSHNGGYTAWMLHHMKAIDETRAPNPTEQDWEDMNTHLKYLRKEHIGTGIAQMLYRMKSLEESHEERQQPPLPPLRKF